MSYGSVQGKPQGGLQGDAGTALVFPIAGQHTADL
jgi:hypothetical protein